MRPPRSNHLRPGVDYFCNLDYDPLLFMQDNNKTYGKDLAFITSAYLQDCPFCYRVHYYHRRVAAYCAIAVGSGIL